MYPVTYITRADILRAAKTLDAPPPVLQAVAAVEARSSGFLKGADLPCMLFEGHKFHAFTDGAHSATHPHISHPKWTTKHYRGGAGEYARLREALRLCPDDPAPALKAASWGMFQIMGFNHRLAGFETVRAYVNATAIGEGRQLDAFVAAAGLADELRDAKWAPFARAYNGPGYKANAYDVKLASAFHDAVARNAALAAQDDFTLERGDMQALQIALNVALQAGLAPDGWIGPATSEALRRYQAQERLPETGAPDRATCDRLGLDLSAYAATET
jgi:hypothetical protein